jgi:lipopolysaccharide transport system ATP-binding protein
VSHHIPMVASLCKRCLLLRGGQLSDDGIPSSVILNYQNVNQGSAAFVDYTHSSKQPGDKKAKLLQAWVEGRDGKQTCEVAIEHPFSIVMIYEILDKTMGSPTPIIHISDSKGNYAFGSGAKVDQSEAVEPGVYLARCEVPANLLNDGLFSAGLALIFFRSGAHVSFSENHSLAFNVVDGFIDVPTRDPGYTGPIEGIFRPNLNWSIKAVELVAKETSPN